MFITSKLRYLFVQRVRFMKQSWKLLERVNKYVSYDIKWSFFSYLAFLTHQLFDNVDIFYYVKITFVVVCLH